MGAQYVLITGTHDNTVKVCNTLYHGNGMVSRETWPRLPGSYHGSGCTLASAIAGTLANGLPLPDAVRETFPSQQRIRLPMMPNNRSLNLSNSVAVVAYEAMRQMDFQNLAEAGPGLRMDQH